MEIYTIKQFADMIGKTTKTLRTWDSKGILVANRTLTNHRYYTDEHLIKCGFNPSDVKVSK